MATSRLGAYARKPLSWLRYISINVSGETVSKSMPFGTMSFDTEPIVSFKVSSCGSALNCFGTPIKYDAPALVTVKSLGDMLRLTGVAFNWSVSAL